MDNSQRPKISDILDFCPECYNWVCLDKVDKYTTRCPVCNHEFKIEPTLFEVLDDRRKELGWSTEALCRASGVRNSTLWRMKHNHTKPTYATVFNLAQALGLPLDEILKVWERTYQKIKD